MTPLFSIFLGEIQIILLDLERNRKCFQKLKRYPILKEIILHEDFLYLRVFFY